MSDNFEAKISLTAASLILPGKYLVLVEAKCLRPFQYMPFPRHVDYRREYGRSIHPVPESLRRDKRRSRDLEALLLSFSHLQPPV